MHWSALAAVTALVVLPLHADPMHLLQDSVLGVLLGVGAVGVYVAALRWLSGDDRRADDRSGGGGLIP